MVKYIHDDKAHNLDDPRIIVPVIMEVLHPESVVDVGCGTGTFLQVFKENGVDKILGLDGDWVNRDLLSGHIDLANFKIIDIEKGFEIDDKFDLVLCLEVLEHVDDANADTAVKSLTELSEVILFSASIPGQMGQNHVNEQWPEYWIEKFNKHNYTFHDVFRPVFWNNKNLARWYKQNMFLVVKNGQEERIKGFEKYFEPGIKAMVHPEYFGLRVNELEELIIRYEILSNQCELINKGKAAFSIYVKLIAKYFLSRLLLLKK
jgi:SAM-dependent methyltransferase